MGFFSFDFFCVGIVQLNEASTRRRAVSPGLKGRENADLIRGPTAGANWGVLLHDEGSRATSQARGQVTDTRRSHKDAAWPSYQQLL